jgi:transcription factor SPN1
MIDEQNPLPPPVKLPSFKKKIIEGQEPKKPKKKRRERLEEPQQEEEELDEHGKKIREAQRDVEEALNRLKPKRSKRAGDLMEEGALDDMMVQMSEKMKKSAEMDNEFNRNRQPAIAKIKLLPSILEQLNKAHLFEQFLDNNILEGIRLWLEPLQGDGSLPSLDIQRAMIKVLSEMPIRTEHLRESGIGRIIMFYSKCDYVVPEIQRIVQGLLGNASLLTKR